MGFVTLKTDGAEAQLSKTLLCAHAGWGKTTQCKLYQEHFGKGFIISGEGGLASVADACIDYLPFSSWDGEHDLDKQVYSFRGIVHMMCTPEFHAQGYKWVALDSLTELSERLHEHLDHKHEGNKNGYALWGDYSRDMGNALKWFRDLKYHVLVTCLLGEELDDNGVTNYWPLVKGSKVSKQLPGLFDNVFIGKRVTRTEGDLVVVDRQIITEEVNGYHGKARDPHRRLQPIENESSVPALIDRMFKKD